VPSIEIKLDDSDINFATLMDFSNFDANSKFILLTMDLGLIEVPYTRVNQSIASFVTTGVALGKPGLIQEFL